MRSNRILRMFGRLLHQPHLWHLNRRSVSRAVLVGTFWAVVPMPFQMIPGTACAILARANLGIALVLIWITNPLTLAPVLYGCYRFGRLLLGHPPAPAEFTWSWSGISQNLTHIWQPLYLGSLVGGLLLGLSGFVGVRLFWRWNIASRWQRRRKLLSA